MGAAHCVPGPPVWSVSGGGIARLSPRGICRTVSRMGLCSAPAHGLVGAQVTGHTEAEFTLGVAGGRSWVVFVCLCWWVWCVSLGPLALGGWQQGLWVCLGRQSSDSHFWGGRCPGVIMKVMGLPSHWQGCRRALFLLSLQRPAGEALLSAFLAHGGWLCRGPQWRMQGPWPVSAGCRWSGRGALEAAGMINGPS